MVGYATGTYHSDLDIGTDILQADSKIDGLTFGGRGGLSFNGFQLGLDYAKSDFKVKQDDDLGTDKIKTSETAVFLGYRFWFLRIYGGYIFNAKIDDSILDSASGFKVGLSFYAFRNVAISIETRNVEFDPETDEDGDKLDVNYGTAALLVSFPFEV